MTSARTLLALPALLEFTAQFLPPEGGQHLRCQENADPDPTGEVGPGVLHLSHGQAAGAPPWVAGANGT